MPLPCHFATRLTIVSLGLVLLTGCQSFSTASSTARLRVIDLSTDAGRLDVYRNGHGVAFNLEYGGVTSYVALAPGTFGMAVSPAESRQTLSSAKAALHPGVRYTLLIAGPLATLQQTLLTDQLPSPGPAIRFIHQAERAGPVDVYLVPAGMRLASLRPIAANLAPGAVTGYLPTPDCVCAAVVLPAGTPPSASAPTLRNGRLLEYSRGSARTMVLLDPATASTPSLDVLETTDTDDPAS